MIVSCTGPRPMNYPPGLNKKTAKENIDRWFADNIRTIEYVTCGMAMGFDWWVAEAAIKYQAPIVAYLPHRTQDAKWDIKSKATYLSLLNQCYRTVYTSEKYYDGCELDRNTKMIKDADVVLTLRNVEENRKFGGTYSTLKKAYNQGKDIINFFTDPPSVLMEV